ncbi:hypothetical protein SDC9_204404 [bioreactor metagenome]|uniref:Uncharacterized protein n=1 Tax=bioreactor metagenome TaxID=1076179 RepID=A0A645JB31_9ZZZZ
MYEPLKIAGPVNLRCFDEGRINLQKPCQIDDQIVARVFPYKYHDDYQHGIIRIHQISCPGSHELAKKA